MEGGENTMIEFNLHGIKINITAEELNILYKDGKNDNKSRLKREVCVEAQFWDFKIPNGNFQQFSFVKSVCQFFLHLYWKRSGKDTSPVEFAKEISNPDCEAEKLIFSVRQKRNHYYLHICHEQGGMMLNEVKLDGQEVIQLDIAIGKAIGLISPM